MKFRICVERGRPFIGVAAAKESISTLLDVKNAANLEQHVASAKAPPVSAKKQQSIPATSDADTDAEIMLMRLSSSVDQPEILNDPTDCIAILRSFQVGLTLNANP